MREQMTPQSLVQAYNKFVYQKKAGQYSLPAFSVTNYCRLCSSGSICLGSCCYGPRNVKTQLSIKDSFEIQEKCPSSALGLLRDPSSASIPGLHRDPSSASSTLTAIEKTPVYNKGIQYSQITVDLCPTVLKKKKKRSQRGRKTPVEKLTFHCSTEAYNLKTLLSILKGNKKQHKKQMFSTASVGLAQVTSYSLLRKLRSSEAPCPCKRKKNKPVKPVPLSKKLTKIGDSSIEEIILRNYIDSWYPLLLKKISQLQSSESWPLPLSNSKTSNDTAVLEGGGGSNERGGKRSNSGRKKGSVSTLKDVNWKKYKKMSKKEKKHLDKTNKKIGDFFGIKVVTKEDEYTQESIREKVEDFTKDMTKEEFHNDSGSKNQYENIMDVDESKSTSTLFPDDLQEYWKTFEGQALSFFQNGCFAKKEDIFSTGSSNYSCAVDSLLNVGEAVILSGNTKSVLHKINYSPILQEVKKSLIWRLNNKYHWNHGLRNPLWKYLASSFPQAFCPIGKVTAAVEPAMKELEKLWLVEIILDTVCSECGNDLGTFHLACEEILLSAPKNRQPKNLNYTLTDLYLDRLDKHANNVLSHKIKCNNIACSGRAKHKGLDYENIKIPPFLFFNFHVAGNQNNYHNDLKDSCILEENIHMANNRLKLLCGLMATQAHFFSICKLFGKYYKLDNMIQEETTKAYNTFKEAYDGKASTSQETNFHLSKKSIRPRKGAVYFAIYQGEDRSEVKEIDWAKKLELIANLNDLPNLMADIVETVVPNIEAPDSPVDKKYEQCMPEDVEDSLHVADSETDSNDLSGSGDEEMDDEKWEIDSNESDKYCHGDEVQECESHTSKCNVDYRLYTFQDMGRYMRNNPGSYYDHSKNLWFCSVCQNFGGAGKQRSEWVEKGVKLGITPGRAFQRHFTSEKHRRNLELKKLFGYMRSEEKTSHIMKLFNLYNRSDSDKVGENRYVFKIMFRICHHIIKKMMSNHSYEDLVRLVSDCGSDALKKFIIKSPKNATYLSERTFSNILKVLNDFTEEPLLKSLKAANHVTLFHDETTDVRNHSEAAVFGMFNHEDNHKEHYLGIIHMKGGLKAIDHYTETLNLCKSKGLDLSKVQFIEFDGCNTNDGDWQGFKLYFRYHNPHNIHQICNSHT